MAKSSLWLAGMALLGAPFAAEAQTGASQPVQAAQPAQANPAPPAKSPAKPAAKSSDKAPAKPSSKTVEAVTVTAAAPETQSSIDKQTYTLGKDLLATTGSVADALRNLPSVDVDVQGNLSLRGDPNVTILVDGKPSPQFDGKGRADALQQLPADQIERVEVIPNPSASLNPEGSGGIINLITKKSRGSGLTGSAYATIASAGLKRAGINLGYNSPKLAITGALAGNYQRNKQHSTDERGTVEPTSGEVLKTTDFSEGRNLTRGPTARLNVTYNADSKDVFTGSENYNESLAQGHPFDRYVDYGPDGQPASILARLGERRGLEISNSLTAGWKHTFGEGHDLSADLIYNTDRDGEHILYVSTQAPPVAAIPLEVTQDNEADHHAEFRLTYSQHLAGGALTAGYELKHDDNDYNHTDQMGPTADSLAPVDSLANHLAVEQTIHAAYATYQHAFGDLDAQAGLRLEDVQLAIDQLTSGERDRQDYVKAYPSLHLSYKLDDERKLTASYGVRVQRPPADLLNPLLQVIDPRDVSQGNPDLKPQETQSYELGYQQRVGQGSYQATFYYRRNLNQIAGLIAPLGGGMFEYTFGNLGGSQAAGVELVANGKLTSALSYNLSGNLYWNEINAANLNLPGDRSIVGESGRGSLNWQVRPDDMLQFNLLAYGKRLQAQGVLEPFATINLGWRHKVNDRITATVTVQDALDSNRFHRVLDTPTLTEDLRFAPVSQAVFFRLDYRFGGGSGKPAHDPGFEYENAPGPGGGPGH
jgi:outer membrane receptor protein involved in Fe transport